MFGTQYAEKQIHKIANNCLRKQQKLKIKGGLHSLILDCTLVWIQPSQSLATSGYSLLS